MPNEVIEQRARQLLAQARLDCLDPFGDRCLDTTALRAITAALTPQVADEGREADAWSAGKEDADGNELITVRKDEWDRYLALKDGPPYASDSWAENGYASPAEEINDMAEVGRSLMDRMASVICSPGPFKGWSPMDDPAELVTDMANWIDENAQPKAAAVDREAVWHAVFGNTGCSEKSADTATDAILKIVGGL